MDERHTLSSAAMQAAIGCDLCGLVYIGVLRTGTPEAFFPLMLPLFGLLAYLTDRLFLRRERPLWAVAVLNLLLTALAVGAVWAVDGWVGWVFMGFSLLFCAWLAVTAAWLTLTPPTLHQLIVCLDLSILLLVLLTGFLSFKDLSPFWGAPVAAGCAAALLGVASRRVSRRLGGRDWSVLGLVFLGLSALLLVLVRFAAAPAGRGLVALWTGLAAAVKFLLSILWWAFVSLLSLMPQPEGSGSSLPPAGAEVTEGAGELTSSPLLAILILALFAAAAAVVLLRLLAHLGKLRVGGRQVSPDSREERRKASLWAGLKTLLAGWHSRWRLIWFRWRHRDTPRGLYCVLVHRCRLGPWHKKQGETPREFLSRLAEGAGDDPDLETALSGFIPKLEEALYRPGTPEGKVPGARLIRRRIGFCHLFLWRVRVTNLLISLQ